MIRKTQVCTDHSTSRTTFLQQASRVPYKDEDGKVVEGVTMKMHLEEIEVTRPEEFRGYLQDYCRESPGRHSDFCESSFPQCDSCPNLLRPQVSKPR